MTMKSFATLACFASIAVTFVNGSAVLWPLYVKPEEHGKNWEPIYNAAKKYPSLQFQAIIRPTNYGPLPEPDDDMKYGIRRLTDIKNIQVIGYTPTGYGKNSSSAIKSLVDMYHSWPRNFRPHGIFFDEVDHGTVPGSWATLQEVTEYAKDKGFGNLIVNNMLTVPPNATAYDWANQTIVYEGTWPAYRAAVPGLDAMEESGDKLSIMIYCITDYEMAQIADKYTERGYGSILLTDGGSFQQWFPYFDKYIRTMAFANNAPAITLEESSYIPDEEELEPIKENIELKL